MTLERPTFSTTKFAEGYDMGEVDDLVDLVFKVLALDEPTLPPEQVQNVIFTPVRLREGYVMDQVDQWIDDAVVEMRRHAAGHVDPAPVADPGLGLPTPAGDPVAAAAAARAAYEPTRSTAVTEVPSGGPGLYLIVLGVVVVLAVVFFAIYA